MHRPSRSTSSWCVEASFLCCLSQSLDSSSHWVECPLILSLRTCMSDVEFRHVFCSMLPAAFRPSSRVTTGFLSSLSSIITMFLQASPCISKQSLAAKLHGSSIRLRPDELRTDHHLVIFLPECLALMKTGSLFMNGLTPSSAQRA